MISTLLVDSREPEWIAQALISRGWAVEIVELPSADYLHIRQDGETIAIERKTASDLLNSLSSGRLSEQLRHARDRYSLPVLLIEGDLRMDPDGVLRADGRRTGWQYAAVEGALAVVQLAGILVYRWPIVDTPNSLNRILNLLDKPSHDLLSRKARPVFVSLNPEYTQQVWCLSALPGIGPETAASLLETYGSIWNVMKAVVEDPEAVQSVKIGGRRLGKIRYQKLREAIVGPHRVEFAGLCSANDVGSNPTGSTTLSKP